MGLLQLSHGLVKLKCVCLPPKLVYEPFWIVAARVRYGKIQRHLPLPLTRHERQGKKLFLSGEKPCKLLEESRNHTGQPSEEVVDGEAVGLPALWGALQALCTLHASLRQLLKHPKRVEDPFSTPAQGALGDTFSVRSPGDFSDNRAEERLETQPCDVGSVLEWTLSAPAADTNESQERQAFNRRLPGLEKADYRRFAAILNPVTAALSRLSEVVQLCLFDDCIAFDRPRNDPDANSGAGYKGQRRSQVDQLSPLEIEIIEDMPEVVKALSPRLARHRCARCEFQGRFTRRPHAHTSPARLASFLSATPYDAVRLPRATCSCADPGPLLCLRCAQVDSPEGRLQRAALQRDHSC
eukprot:scaffold101_cov230-Pinguiococcus_pyrenoidosus.AAC.17